MLYAWLLTSSKKAKRHKLKKSSIMAKSFLNDKSLPRGLRNNNPGNLIKTGTTWQKEIQSNDTRFEAFANVAWGLRALMINLRTLHGRGANTISKLITRWAPASDGNNTTGYIAKVSQMTGIGKDAPLTLSEGVYLGLAKAIVSVENGEKYAALIPDADYKEAFALMSSKTAVKAVSVLAAVLVPFVVFFYTYISLTL